MSAGEVGGKGVDGVVDELYGRVREAVLGRGTPLSTYRKQTTVPAAGIRIVKKGEAAGRRRRRLGSGQERRMRTPRSPSIERRFRPRSYIRVHLAA